MKPVKVTVWSPFPAVGLVGWVIVRKPEGYVVAFYLLFGVLELKFFRKATNGRP